MVCVPHSVIAYPAVATATAAKVWHPRSKLLVFFRVTNKARRSFRLDNDRLVQAFARATPLLTAGLWFRLV